MFLKLTDHNRKPVLVNMDHVLKATTGTQGGYVDQDYTDIVGTHLTSTKDCFFVIESLDDIAKALEAGKG